MATAAPPTCEIRAWPIFAPGYWRGALYTPADCQRLVQNFDRLKGDGYVDPVTKLGHSRQQALQKRLRESLGFINLGDFAALTCDANGIVRAWITNVPTAVGAQMNAGGIRSGSVELIPWIADPDDPGRRVQGPILTGIAYLGEEHPAVKGVVARPKAVFADGTPVPPATDPAPWLEAMADVARMSATTFSESSELTFRHCGAEYPVTAICFSEMDPMDKLDPEFLKSIGLTPEQIADIMAQIGGAPGAAAPSAKTGPAPTPTPVPGDGDAGDMPGAGPKGNMSHDDQTQFSAAEKKMFAEMTRRLGAVEAKLSDAAKEKDMACSAAYAERVEAVLKENVRRIPPKLRAHERALGLQALTTKTYGAASGDAEAAFAAWRDSIESRPEAAGFSDALDDGKPAVATNPLLEAIFGSDEIKRYAPGLKNDFLAATGAK